METVHTVQSLAQMPYRELQGLCKKYGLKAVGSTEELRERLEMALGLKARPLAEIVNPPNPMPYIDPQVQAWYLYQIQLQLAQQALLNQQQQQQQQQQQTQLQQAPYFYQPPDQALQSLEPVPLYQVAQPAIPLQYATNASNLPQLQPQPRQYFVNLVDDKKNESKTSNKAKSQAGQKGTKRRRENEVEKEKHEDEDDDDDFESLFGWDFDEDKWEPGMWIVQQEAAYIGPPKKSKRAEQKARSAKKKQEKEQAKQLKVASDAITSAVASRFPKTVKKPKGLKGVMDAKAIVNTVKSYAVHSSPLVHMWMDCLDIIGKSPNPGATPEQIQQVEAKFGTMPDELKELLSFSNGSDRDYVAWLPSTDELLDFYERNSYGWGRAMSRVGLFPFGDVRQPSCDTVRVIDSSGLVISIEDDDLTVLASNVSHYVDGFHRLLCKTRDEILAGKRQVDDNEDPYQSLTQEDLFEVTEGGKYVSEHRLDKIDHDLWSRWDRASFLFE